MHCLVVVEKKISLISVYFLYFFIISPRKRVGLCINKSLVELVLRCWRRFFLKKLFMNSCYFVIISTWKRAWSFTWTMDNGQIVIKKVHLSLQLRWAKNMTIFFFTQIFLYFTWITYFNCCRRQFWSNIFDVTWKNKRNMLKRLKERRNQPDH